MNESRTTATVKAAAESLVATWEDAETAVEAALTEPGELTVPHVLVVAWLEHHHLHQPAKAAERLDAWEDPAEDWTPALLEQLAAAYEATEDAEAWIGVALERLDHLERSDARADLSLQIASRLKAHHADDPARGAEGAALVLERALRDTPDREDVRTAFLAHSTPERAAEVLRELLHGADADASLEASAPIHVALAALYAGPLADELLAESHAISAFRAAPTNAITFSGALAAFDRAGDAEAALDVAIRQFHHDGQASAALAERLRAASSWDLLIDVLAHLREDATSEARVEEARLRIEHRDEVDEASALLDLAFEHAEDRVALADTAMDLLGAALEDDARAGWLERIVAHAEPERAERAAWEAAALRLDAGEAVRAAALVAPYRDAATEDAALTLLVAIDEATPAGAPSVALLRRWQAAAADVPERTRRAVRVADALEAAGEDATAALEEAIAADPGRIDVARRLADRYVAATDWTAAEVVLSRLVLAPHDDAEAHAASWQQLAEVLTTLGERVGACRAWGEAWERSEQPRRQRAALEALLRAAEHDPSVSLPAWTDDDLELIADTRDAALAHAAASWLQSAGRPDSASRWLNRALEIHPTHTRALRALVDHAPPEDEDAIAALFTLAKSAPNEAERFQALLELSGAYRARGDAADAIATLELAAEINPNALEPLHRLLGMHKESAAWDLAIDVLVRLANKSTEPERVARYWRTIAALERDELARPARAARALERAAGLQPLDATIFDELDALLRDAGWWAEVEAATLRHVERLVHANAGNEPVAELHVRLGDLYASHLNRPDDAIAAWRRVLEQAPDRLDLYERIARTYPSAGKTDKQLIDEHQAIITLAPDKPESHYLLHMAYKRERAFDRAWLHAAALRVLGDDDPKAGAFFEEHRPQHVQLARRALNDSDWRRLEAELLPPPLWAFARTLGRTLVPMTSRSIKDWGVNPKRDRRTSDTLGPLAGLLSYLPDALGVQVEAVYVTAAVAGVHPAGVDSSVLVVGQATFEQPVDRRVAFTAARAIGLLHPSCALASRLAHPGTLYAVAAAAFGLAGLPDSDAPPETQAWLEAISSEPEPQTRAVVQAVRTYAAEGGRARDVQLLPHAAEMLATHLATMLTGDLLRSIEAIQHAPTCLSAQPLAERLVRVLGFWSSDTHAHQRAELGLGVGQADGESRSTRK